MLATLIPDLLLCPMEERDASELFTLTASNRAYLRRWLSWVDDIRSAEDTTAYVRNTLALQRLGLRIDYTLRLQGRMIGTIAYHALQRPHRSGTVGYWLEFASNGHGYMTAAVRRIVEHGFSDLDLNRIEVRVAIGNHASANICARLGFKEEGVLREAEWLYDHFVDVRVHSLLRREWACDGRKNVASHRAPATARSRR